MVQDVGIEPTPRDYRSRTPTPARENRACRGPRGSTFELILLWYAVRELNPHLLGVGQLFWSVELPAQNLGGGCRSRTCLGALMHPTARVGDPANPAPKCL